MIAFTPLVVVAIGFIIFIMRRYSDKPRAGNRIEDIAQAIAKAEGFYVEGSLPQRRNNPGSLKLSGDSLTGFPSVEDGWNALRKQIRIILDGRSSFYKSDMTIEQIALIWTGNDNPEAWARIVSGELGVAGQTPLISV